MATKRGRSEEAEKQETKKKAKATPGVTALPDDILTDIFLRLDCLSLLRLKLLSKSCYAFINNPSFTASHLHQTLTLNRATLMFHNTHTFFSFDHKRRLPRRVVCPFVSSSDTAVNVLGSCNGVFLIGAYPRSVGSWGDSSKRIFDVLYLWNPTTAEFIRIPEIFSEIPKHRINCHKVVYGLGYDSSKDDYKVIRILYYYDNVVPERHIHDFESDVHIYSLRANSHKRIQDAPYLIRSTTKLPDGIVSGTFSNGAIHWLGYNTVPDDVIVCFDSANEEFKVLHKLPALQGNPSCLELGMLRTSLGLYHNRQGYTDEYFMSKYGANESWVRISPIKHPEFPQNSLSPPVCTQIAGGKDGRLIQWSYKDLLWYNRTGAEWRNSREYRMEGLPEDFIKSQFYVLTYFSSLVSLKRIQGTT